MEARQTKNRVKCFTKVCVNDNLFVSHSNQKKISNKMVVNITMVQLGTTVMCYLTICIIKRKNPTFAMLHGEVRPSY